MWVLGELFTTHSFGFYIVQTYIFLGFLIFPIPTSQSFYQLE